MKFKTSLYLLSASLCLLGLSIAGQVRPGKTLIGDIQPSDIGEKVVIKGKVLKAHSTESSTFLTVSDGSGNISVVAFDKKMIFSEAESLTLSGQVTLYQGRLEIVADRFYLS